MSRASDRLRCSTLAGLLMLAAVSAEAQPPVRQVLVLQSFDRGNMVLDHFTGNFRVDLGQGAGTPVNIVQVTVGPTGLSARLNNRSSTSSVPPSPIVPSRTLS